MSIEYFLAALAALADCDSRPPIMEGRPRVMVHGTKAMKIDTTHFFPRDQRVQSFAKGGRPGFAAYPQAAIAEE